MSTEAVRTAGTTPVAPTWTGETPVGRGERPRLWWEVAIVLGLSLGQSAIYSIVTIVDRSTQSTPLSNQTAQVNPSQSSREVFDFLYQFLDNAFPLFAVALVIFLLWQPRRSGFRRIGFDLSRPGRDLGGGLLLFLVIGIPGILFYALGRVLGLTVQVQASPLDTHWWTVPILVFAALRAGLQEEVIVVGYLFTRLRQLVWGKWWIIVAAALLRGSYHLYQGFGPFVGNAIMGVVFGWCYTRWGRVMPLVVAHVVIDIVSFVGYPLAVALWPHIFA
ncbi:CPBP family intramembrane glutamic endopeptidase [Leifsonia shinshuensis]|uniref:CPBP family intramembrane metalloprotease n=1 Tax=Leifsonia shinshuensis TaxID=150026 RepID=A0A7G6Y5P2_9MICO|nr:CPBP family intramembrane glutamic endopeptidase [Leifsonia shinshuensis]QNE33807.1 CPBP family intramembrane metalloprotease [Leifsonia shinshuensis]